jgi:rod shape-determining protein MreC
MRVRISADYERLEFLRVLRSYENERLTDPGQLIAPAILPGSENPASAPDQAEAAEAENG